SSLHIYRSNDEVGTFGEIGHFQAINGRDIRDPSFFIVGDELHIKAITRLPVTSSRDSDVASVTVVLRSTDGANWSDAADAAESGWSLWRVVEHAGVFYAAAYQDGDQQVVLYRSTDGVHFTPGPQIYGVAADTPLETELVFVPSGKLLALVRMDGTDQ